IVNRPDAHLKSARQRTLHTVDEVAARAVLGLLKFPIGDAVFLQTLNLAVDRGFDISRFDALPERSRRVERARAAFLIGEAEDVGDQRLIFNERLIEARTLSALKRGGENLQRVKVRRVAGHGLESNINLWQTRESIVNICSALGLLLRLSHINGRRVWLARNALEIFLDPVERVRRVEIADEREHGIVRRVV